MVAILLLIAIMAIPLLATTVWGRVAYLTWRHKNYDFDAELARLRERQ